MSCRVVFWLSSSRALDTKVTKSKGMMKKGMRSMTQQEEEKSLEEVQPQTRETE